MRIALASATLFVAMVVTLGASVTPGELTVYNRGDGGNAKVKVGGLLEVRIPKAVAKFDDVSVKGDAKVVGVVHMSKSGDTGNNRTTIIVAPEKKGKATLSYKIGEEGEIIEITID